MLITGGFTMSSTQVQQALMADESVRLAGTV